MCLPASHQETACVLDRIIRALPVCLVEITLQGLILRTGPGSERDFTGQDFTIIPQNAKEVHHISIQIVDNLMLGWRFLQEDRPGAEEGFHIDAMLREVSNNPTSEPPLCTWIF